MKSAGPKRKPRTFKQFVFDRLSDGKSVDFIFREAGCRWNYITRIAREWHAEQEALRATLTLSGGKGKGRPKAPPRRLR